MGVNKSNTRYIIHFHYPTNIASYLQEIGRAGRDGEPSIAILLCSPLDHDLPISIIEDELPSQSQIQFFFFTTGKNVSNERITNRRGRRNLL